MFLQASLKSCRGVNLLKLLDERAGAAVHSDNLQAANTAVTVVGAGPIGLRTAIGTHQSLNQSNAFHTID